MKVLFCASEALPFSATGGLADVAGSLPQALRARLIGCRVVVPLYDGIPQELRDQMHFVTSISVPVAWRRLWVQRSCEGRRYGRGNESAVRHGPQRDKRSGKRRFQHGGLQRHAQAVHPV